MTHEPDRFTAERGGSLVALRWHEGVVITRADIKRSGEVIRGLTPDGYTGLAVYVRKVVRIDPDARELITTTNIGPKVALICSDPVDAVITGFAHQSVSRTRFFGNEAEALEWLQHEEQDRRDE